jgi:phage recombination protein Bet
VTTALVTLSTKLAERFGMGADGEALDILKATAFKGPVSDAQMTALLVVAQQYGLNPWTKEIYAFPDRNNGIVPVVGVDGWARIINEHPQFDGMEFAVTPDEATCTMYRKDRGHPIRVTEYMAECKRDGVGPWKSHPLRMLRHKSMIQCARLAFGFVGIVDQDEAERIVDGGVIDSRTGEIRPTPQRAAASNAPADLAEYEAEHLGTLRDAAMEGTDALSKAFQALPKSPQKAALWQAHGDSLKRAAANAEAEDVIPFGEVAP